MDKEEQLRLCKEYYKNLCKEVKANKVENRRLSPTGYWARTAEDAETPTKLKIFRKWTTIRMLWGAALVIPAIATLGASWPLTLTLSIAVLAPTMNGLLPGIIASKLGENPGKLGFMMNKLFLNYTMRRFKVYFENEFPFILNAKSAKDVDQEDINRFIERAYGLAMEYDNFAFNCGDKVIENVEDKAYRKIEKILEKQGYTDKTKSQIQKIYDKCTKTTNKWRDFYSSQKERIEDLYLSVVEFDPENKEELLCIRQAKCELENYDVAYKKSEFKEDVEALITRYNYMQNGKPMDANLFDADPKANSKKTDFTKGKNKDN